jgi:hypothetical protein
MRSVVHSSGFWRLEIKVPENEFFELWVRIELGRNVGTPGPVKDLPNLGMSTVIRIRSCEMCYIFDVPFFYLKALYCDRFDD